MYLTRKTKPAIYFTIPPPKQQINKNSQENHISLKINKIPIITSTAFQK
jgi:hypothetical protein